MDLKTFGQIEPSPTMLAEEIGRRCVDGVISGNIRSVEGLQRTTKFVCAKLDLKKTGLGSQVLALVPENRGFKVATFLLP